MSPTPSTTKGSAKAKKPRKAGISPVYTRRIALKADAELIGSSTYAALERLMMGWISATLKDAVPNSKLNGRVTISKKDIVQAARRVFGVTLY